MSEERRKQSLGDKATPYLVSITIFMLGNVIAITNKIDDKLFKHLTNDEIHIPRGIIVNKGEFDIITKMRELQFTRIDTKLDNLENLIQKHMGIKE